MTELQNLTYHQLARYFYFPDRESLGIEWKIDLEVLMDLHVLRPQESKNVVLKKCCPYSVCVLWM